MEKRFLEVPFEIKAIHDEDGIFEGYGSVFGNVDEDGDIIETGAFTKSLLKHHTNQTQPALLWMHDPMHPVGRYLEVREDARGLYVKGQLILDSSQGRDAYALLKGGAINGLSIGYVPKAWELNKTNKTRQLKEVELWEVSLVTFPANTLARIMTVKHKISTGDIPSLQEMERFLCRECGMSRQESQLLLKSGYEAYLDFATEQQNGEPFTAEKSDEDLTLNEKQIAELTTILKNF